MTDSYRYLFGPVPSRRLGRSLGVDLTPYKTCSFDCIFCQLGRTTDRTVERREYVPVDDVTGELADWIETDGAADVVTLAGSGEPTLHARFDRVIDFVRGTGRLPVALLTNGSLLSRSEVRAAAAKADIVKASLSVWDSASLTRINRPDPRIDFDGLVEGLVQFRREFRGELWLEVFMIPDINTDACEAAAIGEYVRRIFPDRVQLNTAVRPPCEDSVQPVAPGRLQQLARVFEPPAEVIAEYDSGLSPRVRATESDVLGTLERRPCTLDELCSVFGMHRNEGAKIVGKLLRTGRIELQRGAGGSYCVGRRIGGSAVPADLGDRSRSAGSGASPAGSGRPEGAAEFGQDSRP